MLNVTHHAIKLTTSTPASERCLRQMAVLFGQVAWMCAVWLELVMCSS